MVDLGSASADDFEPLVGRSFRAGELTLQLASVTRGTSHAGEPRAPFQLVFTGPRDRFVAQGVLHLSEESAGEFDLFLVPVGMTDEAYEYEAVFA